MRLKSLTLHNFRRYSNDVTVEFGNLTAFVGKNDAGKSSILEALDIFFNEGKGCIKLDKDDINKAEFTRGNKEICLTTCFDELPARVVIDATNETSLEDEFLLNEARQLEVIKKYPGAGSAKVFIRAYHPTNPDCSDLLLKKDTDFRRILDSRGIECADRTRNAVMRKAIWDHYSPDLQLRMVEIDVTKNEAKAIWDKLRLYLPIYIHKVALFPCFLLRKKRPHNLGLNRFKMYAERSIGIWRGVFGRSPLRNIFAVKLPLDLTLIYVSPINEQLWAVQGQWFLLV